MRVEVSFPLDNGFVETTNMIMKAAKKFHGKSPGSGAGFGMRDISLEFKNPADLKEAKKAIKALKIEGLEFNEF
jgi:hypothetical protein